MYIRTEPNEYGTGTSHHVCDTCKGEFTLTPAVGPETPGWGNCMAEGCPSYDPSRDCEPLYMSNSEIAREKKVVDIKYLQERKNRS